MKLLYDLEIFLFFLIFVKLKGFLRCQNREPLVAVGLNRDPNAVDSQVVNNNYFDFFSLFFPLLFVV